MALHGPILLIEDDANDIEAIKSAFRDLKVTNKIVAFTETQGALDYLLITKDEPFIILCDIRMTGMNGLEFRKTIAADEYLRKKTIPFVFFTAIASEEIINEAYDLDIQGFYKKPGNYTELKDKLYAIVVYWKSCLHPNRPF